ncbi:response regulator [Alkalihalobacillus sp. LMS39]|uniref:response regulator transcription factor n=1 Tax=Alkalihalobacillus sp. LMS39 TaxID=2924032 RepID=UPI001FB50DC4|nr:response regulator [Alkalihalobacillus sp. LMS39]UOE93580.1 response regulator [Alkalihalobacillus sp. LMS39]
MLNQVVIVDDEYFVRKGIMTLVNWEKCGFQICAEATNGEDALHIIEKVKPDLVITDIRMPVLDGLDLIHLVNQQETVTKFIILSGHNEFSYAQKAVRYGVHDFLLKPIDKTELEMTLQKLSLALEEEKKMKEYEQEVVLNTLWGHLLSGTVCQAQLEQADVTYIRSATQFAYMIVEINDIAYSPMERSSNELQKQLLKRTVSTFITEGTICMKEHEGNRFGFLFTDYGGHNITTVARRIQEKIQLQVQKCMTLYVGVVVDNINQFPLSYETAIRSLQYKYVSQTNEPIFYEKVKDKPVISIEMEDHFMNALLESIEENNNDLIRKQIDNIFHEFETNLYSPEAVKVALIRCKNKTIKTISGMGGTSRELQTLKLLENVNYCSFTLLQIKEVFSGFVFEVTTYIGELRKENGKGEINKIKIYIDRNFHKSISLKSIATTFYMNPVYMGQLFKKSYGVYFKDYLLSLRIQESKKLLRQTHLRVYEIAEKVGFKNADYFVTQFEKLEKVTPTEYRKLLN